MALSWARARQLNYMVTTLAFLVVVGVIIFFIYKPNPTCFDGKQNQDEEGIDCGGSCALACQGLVRPLKVDWVRPLKVADGWYDLAAQVENPNQKLGNQKIPYLFSAYDADNFLIATRTGSTFVNAGEKFVIFESRVLTNGRKIKTAFLEFPTETPWENISPVPKDISLERRDFSNEPKPTLRLSVSNNSLKKIKDISVITVLSDINGNAFAASETRVDSLAPNSSTDLYFTWPEPFPSEPSYVESYWRLNSFGLGR